MEAINRPKPHVEHKHNPHCTLVGQYFNIENHKVIELVVSIYPIGHTLPGLEVYFHYNHNKLDRHYHSRYYFEGSIPTKYMAAYQRLKALCVLVKPGYKLEI